jgi:hypothetical protein
MKQKNEQTNKKWSKRKWTKEKRVDQRQKKEEEETRVFNEDGQKKTYCLHKKKEMADFFGIWFKGRHREF